MADNAAMPRLSVAPTVRPALVARLAALVRRLRAAEQSALHRAKEIGDELATVPSAAERDAAAEAVGLSARTGRVYVQIAEGWEAVLAERCQTISCALDVLKGTRKRSEPDQIEEPEKIEIVVFKKKFDHLPSRELAQVLETVRDRAVEVIVKLRDVERQPDPEQPELPGSRSPAQEPDPEFL